MQLRTLVLGLFLFRIQLWTETKAFSLVVPISQVKASDYVGTWVGYTANGSELKVVLREQKEFRFVNGQSRDVIVGSHSYMTKEKRLISESLSKPKDKFILIGVPDIDNPNEMEVSFGDEVHHKIVNITLRLVDGNPKSLHWLFKSETETITINAKEKTLRGISVPTDLILKKVD